MMPATNAPRIVSSPNWLDRARKIASTRTARRMRICAVPPSSASRRSARPGCCSARRSTNQTTAVTPAKMPKNSTWSRIEESPSAKRIDSSITALNSATDPTIRMVCPTGVADRPAPRRTGMMAPRPVADRMMAMSDGVWTTSSAPRTIAAISPSSRPTP